MPAQYLAYFGSVSLFFKTKNIFFFVKEIKSSFKNNKSVIIHK